jgi:thioesterase domain-containing protein
MTAARLLAELRELDVHVVLDGDRLRLNAPAGTLTEEHKRELADRKPEVIAFLQAAQQLSTQPRAIVPLQASGTRTPIFAVAGHNGDVFAYRALAGHLGADQPFFGLQPRGLEQTEDPMTRVEDIAEYFASQIGEFRPDGAVTIAGYCAGGSIAYELARRLSNSGAEVSNLILFGAPHCSAYRRAKQSLIMAGHYTTRSVTHARALLTMPAAERSAYIAQRTARLSPPDASDPVMLRRSAVEDATVAAVRAYSPAPSPVHIDFMLPCEAWKRSLDDPLRWGAHAGSSEVFVGPSDCNGDTMLLPDHAGTFARFVAEAQRRHADS